MADITYNDHPVDNAPAATDYMPYWKVSAGAPRKCLRSSWVGATLTGGGTIATGGFTLTIPATGTAALLGTANTFTAVNAFTQFSNVLGSVRTAVSSVINDDSVAQITGIPDRGIMVVQTGSATTEAAIIAYRTASPPHCAVLANGGQWAAATGVPTGTTGTDNFLTLFADTTGLRIENRRGTIKVVVCFVIW